MPTSSLLIADQVASASAYQRLAAALLQQHYFFDSVMTEATAETQQPRSTEVSESTGANRPGDASVRFVLMRSHPLSVLLVAHPLSEQDAQLEEEKTHTLQTTTHQAPTHTASASTSHSEKASENLRAHISQAVAKAQAQQTQASSSKTGANSDTEIKYRIHLTFDSQEIATFAQHLSTDTSMSVEALQETLEIAPAHATAFVLAWTKELAASPEDGPQADKPQSDTNEKRAVNSAKSIQARGIDSTVPDSTVPDSTVPDSTAPASTTPDSTAPASAQPQDSTQKHTQVAAQSATQATLDNQTQQSLLLNQVITRIRHSLDLPAILETTVAQVREFLEADRLVLYQFDQLDSVDLSYLLEETGTKKTDEKGTDEKGIGLEKQTSVQNQTVASSRSATTDLHKNSGTIIGQCIHAGHVTYEARISEEITSVLNSSEEECFQKVLKTHPRYLLGQPITVNNIEQQYASTPCLVSFLQKAQVKSKIIAPIIVQDQLWGLLIAHQCTHYRQWEDTEVVFLQHIAEHLAVAISQAALYHQLRQQTVSLESCVVERTQNLRDALLAAESANLTKGEFLSTMSHELRTPLTYIIGMSATLLRWSIGELSERQRSYLNTINHSGEQLLGIINDILEFAKVRSGRSLLEFSDISLRSLVDQVLEDHRPEAERQSVEFSATLEIASCAQPFSADAKKLTQILANLVRNAIKFTPAGGKVVLRIWQEAQTTVFQVQDTGIGIPESQKSLLFDTFKQLESPFQRQYPGTGLGLAMTKRLVELHGGLIQVDSVVGEGSSFTVRLPMQTAAHDIARYEVPTTTRLHHGHKRVLLLEKEEDSAAIICDLLTADGYEVIWLVEPEQTLAQLELLEPTILIADLSLLSHDLDEIKSIQLAITAIGAKVLALLGQPVSQSSHIAHHDTLDKPLDPKKLLEKSRQLTNLFT
ncbi:MAG: ATP-binding protein [Cyanobacteria bacterium J06629_19]